jgi:hypothetical protein
VHIAFIKTLSAIEDVLVIDFEDVLVIDFED